MQFSDWLQLALLLTIVILLMKPLGLYLCKVLDPSEVTFLDPVLKPVENFIYRFSGIHPHVEQNWRHYLGSILAFSLVSVIFTYILIAIQYYLPLNPQKFSAPAWHVILNTSVSFMSNTCWQSYGGESTMSYFSQMAALAVQNFVSPAVGLSAAAALVRSISSKGAKTIGNFWADLIRICLYLLLPICIISAGIFISEGVPQNFSSYVKVSTLEGGEQTIAQGPIASLEAIKLLGTNGGGFMNANSAHPYENPTPFSNFFQMLLILLISCAQIYYFGRSVGNTIHAWCILGGLTVLFILGVFVCGSCEEMGNPEWAKIGVSGVNWEGKETRFGAFSSTLYACVTTVVTCGSVNCCHDSLTPIGGMIPMLNIQLNSAIFGGVGAGLYSTLLYVFFAIFICGLIIGRTPEYLGNKIEAFEIKMTMLAILAYVLIVHALTSWSCYSEWGLAGLGNNGPHGFSEMLYAYSSAAANNGSAFAGLSANSVGYDLTLAAAMLFGRFLPMASVVALAGSLVRKKLHPKTEASFPVSSLLFITLLVIVILIVGALTFFPALTLGPIVEQFFMLTGTLFP